VPCLPWCLLAAPEVPLPGDRSALTSACRPVRHAGIHGRAGLDGDGSVLVPLGGRCRHGKTLRIKLDQSGIEAFFITRNTHDFHDFYLFSCRHGCVMSITTNGSGFSFLPKSSYVACSHAQGKNLALLTNRGERRSTAAVGRGDDTSPLRRGSPPARRTAAGTVHPRVHPDIIQLPHPRNAEHARDPALCESQLSIACSGRTRIWPHTTCTSVLARNHG